MNSGRPPEQIGPFRLRKVIGSTPVSKTYIAVKGTDSTRFALKIMEEGSAPGLSAEGLDLIANEAQIAKSLNHPNVVQVHEAAVEKSRLYVCLSLAKGLSTEAVLAKKGKFNPQTAAEIALEAAKALAYGHGRGVYHKNLKTTNVFLLPGGKVTVADFGLGRIPDPLDKAGRGIEYSHMPEFLSPEQAAGDYDRVDQRSDVYALGMFLYRVLTGASPFEEAREALILLQILNDKPVAPRHRDRNIPKSLEAICLKALNKKPHERYWSMAEMATDINRFLCGEPVRALEDAGWNRWLTRITSSKMGMVLAFVGALLLAVGGGVLLRTLASSGTGESGPPVQGTSKEGKGGNRKSGARKNLKRKKARAALNEALALPLTREELKNRIQWLEESVKLDPGFGLAQLHLGYNLLLSGRDQQAMTGLSRGSVKSPTPFSKFLWGLVYHEYHMNVEKARKEFQEGAKLESKTCYGPICRAWMLWLTEGTRKRKEALEALKEAEDPELYKRTAYPWETNLLRGIILQAPPGPKPSAARLALYRSTEAFGGFTPALVRLALAYFNENQLQYAKLYLGEALSIDPSHAHARAIRGLVRLKDLQYEKALTDFNLAAETAPRYVDAHIFRGDTLTNLKRYPEAVRALSKARELKPLDPNIYLKRGLAYYWQGLYPKAEADYRRAVKLAPFSAEMRHHLGSFFQALRRFKEAMTAYNEAIRLAPKGAKHYMARANLNWDLGRRRVACNDYEQAIICDSTQDVAYIRVTKDLLRQGLTEDALAYIRDGLRNCPNSPRRREMEELKALLEQLIREKKKKEKEEEDK
ncbi:MAG: protein kinase domain-containing protein, partial [Planctomycetota bacterium]|jgi:serine/threonine protein kinase/Tfp pilus assembly protein PilF